MSIKRKLLLCLLLYVAVTFTMGAILAINLHVAETQIESIANIPLKPAGSIANLSRLVQDRNAKLFASEKRTTILIIVLIAAAGAITSYAVYVIWFSIAKPLLGLQEAAERVKALDFSYQFPDCEERTEIGRLRHSFHQMLNRLRDSYSELEKFKLAVDGVSEHIIITDPDGVVQFVNPAAEKITGFSREEIIGKKSGSKDLWGGLMPPEFYKKLWTTIKIQKKSFSGEIKNRRKDGTEYYARSTISPILNKDGDVQFFVGIERDITREKEIDRAKSEFVSLASHQLRTPLTSVHWYSQILTGSKKKITKKRQREYLEKIENGAERMVTIVDVLLNVSRIELGTLPVRIREVDTGALIDSVLDEQAQAIKKKGLHVEKKIAARLPKLYTDPTLLRMVIQNLVSNAVKYTQKNGAINLSLKADPKTKRITFTCRDTGYGIPKKDQDKIFTKLFRADNVKQKPESGNGLGLYITKSVLEVLKGRIKFTSAENKGTTFSVSLPPGKPPTSGSKRLKKLVG